MIWKHWACFGRLNSMQDLTATFATNVTIGSNICGLIIILTIPLFFSRIFSIRSLCPLPENSSTRFLQSTLHAPADSRLNNSARAVPQNYKSNRLPRECAAKKSPGIFGPSTHIKVCLIGQHEHAHCHNIVTWQRELVITRIAETARVNDTSVWFHPGYHYIVMITTSLSRGVSCFESK